MANVSHNQMVIFGPIQLQMGVSENVVYPIVPNGFADHYPVFKWLAIIGNINPTFSDKPKWCIEGRTQEEYVEPVDDISILFPCWRGVYEAQTNADAVFKMFLPYGYVWKWGILPIIAV